MSYLVVVTTTVTIYAILTVSLNVVVGYAGQPHVGQGAFFGIGAYLAAVLATRYGVSFWLTLPAAFAAGGLAGVVLGSISLRLREDFFAITTIGLNFVIVAIFQKVPWFGGATGIYGLPLPTIGGYEFDNSAFLLTALVILVVTIGVSAYLERTWFGSALIAVKDDELAAASVGTPVAAYKVAAFVLSTAIAGLAGAVYAFFLSAVTPESFGFTESVVVLAMLMLGGVGTIRGAVLGAVVLGVLPEAFRFISDYRLLVFGVILVLVLRFQPQGLVGEGSLLARGARRVFGSSEGDVVRRAGLVDDGAA